MVHGDAKARRGLAHLRDSMELEGSIADLQHRVDADGAEQVVDGGSRMSLRRRRLHRHARAEEARSSKLQCRVARRRVAHERGESAGLACTRPVRYLQMQPWRPV